MAPSAALRLRPLTSSADAAVVARAHFEHRAEMFAPAGLEPQALQMMCAQQHDFQEAHIAAVFPEAERLMVETDGAVIGRVVLDKSEPAGWHVADIAILSAGQGQGYGTAVLQLILAEARAANAAVSLMVASDNLRAIALYERLGFAATSGSFETHHRMMWQP